MTVSKNTALDNSAMADNQLGSVFLKVRLAKKLSIEDISNAIHLSEKQIQALENNDFNALPEPMITRGFIRNYANYLEIDAEPLLQRYRTLMPEQARSIVVKANVNEVMSHHVQQPWLLYMLGSIAVLLFITVWYYYMDSVKAPNIAPADAKVAVVAQQPEPQNDTQNQRAEAAANQATPTNNVEPASAQNVVPFVSSDNAPSVATPVEVQAPAGQSAVAPQSPVNQASTNQMTASPVAKSPPVANMPLVAKKLEMQFTGESWVSVKDKTRQVILEKTVTAGSSESLDGEPPFKIIIGNATAAAKVKFYGQEVDLAPVTSKNIIRLTLE